jgi:hypothetical protein
VSGTGAIVRRAASALDFGLVSHPSLGLPPVDPAGGDPASAAALRDARGRIVARAIDFAIEAEPAFGPRYPGTALAELRLDVDAMVGRLAEAVAAAQPDGLGRWAEMVVPRFRKKGVPMDDLVLLFEGLRRAAPGAVLPAAMPLVDASLDAGIVVFKWHRRLAGDARKRHPLLAFLYKGA